MPEPGDQLLVGANEAPEILDHVYGDADGTPLIRERAADGLADPPGGVGGKLEAASVVKLPHGLQEAEIPLLDEVNEIQALAMVARGDGDHQPQVGFSELIDELPECRLLSREFKNEGGKFSGCCTELCAKRLKLLARRFRARTHCRKFEGTRRRRPDPIRQEFLNWQKVNKIHKAERGPLARGVAQRRAPFPAARRKARGLVAISTGLPGIAAGPLEDPDCFLLPLVRFLARAEILADQTAQMLPHFPGKAKRIVKPLQRHGHAEDEAPECLCSRVDRFGPPVLLFRREERHPSYLPEVVAYGIRTYTR